MEKAARTAQGGADGFSYKWLAFRYIPGHDKTPLS